MGQDPYPFSLHLESGISNPADRLDRSAATWIHGGLGGAAPQGGGKRPRPGYRLAVALGGVRQELVLRVNTTSTYPADQRPIGRKNPRGRPPGGFL